MVLLDCRANCFNLLWHWTLLAAPGHLHRRQQQGHENPDDGEDHGISTRVKARLLDRLLNIARRPSRLIGYWTVVYLALGRVVRAAQRLPACFADNVSGAEDVEPAEKTPADHPNRRAKPEVTQTPGQARAAIAGGGPERPSANRPALPTMFPEPRMSNRPKKHATDHRNRRAKPEVTQTRGKLTRLSPLGWSRAAQRPTGLLCRQCFRSRGCRTGRKSGGPPQSPSKPPAPAHHLSAPANPPPRWPTGTHMAYRWHFCQISFYSTDPNTRS